MSRSLESRWNACVHRLDLGLYSHPKEFEGGGGGGGVESEPRELQGKNPLYLKNSHRRMEPTTLHQIEQRALHTTS